MSEQLRLFDFDSQTATPARAAKRSRRPDYSLFFAVIPDSHTAGMIAEIGKAFALEKGLEGNYLEAHRLHVTLYAAFVGDFVPPEIAEAAQHVGDSIAGQAFDVRFNCATVYGAARAFVFEADQGVRGIWNFHTE